MNKQAELTRWTPKRLLSLLMALIMTLSLLPPTTALADATEVGNGETYTFDPTIPSTSHKVITNPDGSSTVVMPINAVNTPTQIADGYIDENKSLWGLKFSIGQFSVDKPGNTIEATVDAYLTLKGSTNAKITEVFVTDDKTGSGWGHRADTTRTGNITVGEDGCARFTISVTYKVNGTDTYTKSAHVVIMSLWTGYNVTFTAPAGLTGVTFTGLPSTTAKTVAKDASSDDYEQVYTIKASKDGYTFKGWDLYREGSLSILTQPDTTITGIDGDIQLAAHLEENQDIFFNPVYSGVSGLPYGYKDISQGQTYTIPYTPELSGYDFKGWTVTGATLEADGVSVKNITSQITITPIWEKSDGSTPVGSHKVTFHENAAGVYNMPAPQTVKDSGTATTPTVKPQRDGYTFGGWYTNAACTGAAFDFTTDTVTTDLELYAKWTATPVTVNFPAAAALPAGVTIFPVGGSMLSSIGREAHFTVKVPDKYNTTDLLVSAGHFGTTYSMLVPVARVKGTDPVTRKPIVTLYYQFTVEEDLTDADPTTGTLTLPIAVGAVTVKTFNVTLPTGERFDAAFTAVPNASIPAGKELADLTNVTVAYGGSVSFTVTEREGWTIKNVYDNGAAIKAVDGKYTIANIQADHKIEVNVEQTIFYNVTYAVPGFSSWTQSYQSGTKLGKTADTNNKITALATMIPPTGYTWDGNWYMDAECTTPITDEKPLTVNSDVTVYAKFAPKTVTISYKSGNDTAKVNGTEIPATSKTYGLGAQLTAATPDKAEQGYTFLGWSENPSATAPAYKSGEMYNVDTENNVTLYAVWEKQTFNISLSSGTGYSIHHTQPLQVEYGDTFSFRVAMSKGYSQTAPSVWMNWVDAAGTEHSHQLTNPTETTDGTSGLAVYHYTTPEIYWNATINVVSAADLVYTVTYKYAGLDGRTEYPKNDDTYLTQNVSWNEAAAQPAAPSVEGYKFVGWTTDNNAQYDFTAPVTSDLTIYAVFSAVQPTITRTKANTGTGWKTTGWKWTKDTKINAVANDGGAFFVDYGSDVEFTLNIEEGYDASGVTVSVNGKLLLPYGDATVDGNVTKITYKLTNVTEDSEIVVVGVARKEVKITYYANATDDVEHVPGQQTVKYYLAGNGDNGKLDSAKPTRVGYAFKGWSTDPAASPDAANLYQPGGDATFTSDTNLYAIWEAQELTATLTFSNTALHTDNYDIQYEGKEFALNAKLTARAKGTAIFLVGTENDISKAKQIGEPVTVNSDTASLTVIAGKYVTPSDQNLKYYWVKFQSETAEGYTDCESGPIALKIFSRAITWTPLTDGNSGTLTIKDKDGNTKDAMIAGQTYTLTVNTDKIIGLEALDKDKPTLGNDYYIVWQYKKTATGDWETVNGNFTDTKQYQVTPGESGYEFRAKVYPKGELYNTAAKFNESGAFVNNEYDDCLYTSTTKSDLQETAITLTVVAPSEASNVKINGSAPFTDIGDHKAQFEGQTVTLTAKVTDTTTGTPAVTTGHVNFYRKGAAADTLLNASPIAVGANGVATCEVEISKWTGGNVTDNKDEFYAVYLANATYDTSASWTAATGTAAAAGELKAVYIKSTAIKTPIIESTLANDDGKNATTYTDNLTGLLAGVEHTFTLRQTGAAATADNQFSVVAKDGRTVDAKNYTIQWITKSGDNAETTAATDSKFKTSDNKVGDEIYVRLNPTGDMKTGADSKKAIIGKKQDVIVTVEASDEINSTAETDVYQLNDITLTATVAAKETTSTMKPTGTVAFYYSVDNGTTWTKIGDAKDLAEVAGVMTASIQTDQLPVKAGDNTKQDVKITAVYEGNETFNASATVTGAEQYTITTATGCTTNNDTVIVYSSVVYVKDTVENKTTVVSTKTHESGIYIYAEDDKVLANEGNVNLKLSEVYTLDHDIPLSKLTYGTDYTVQWQMLTNAAAYPDKASATWTNITSATGTTCQIDVKQGAAYRAVITVNDTPIAKGSFTEVQQAIPGHKVYYSNILVAANAPATLTVNVNTSNTSDGYEGIVEGETVTIHTFTSGATGTTPISQLTVNIYPGKPEAVAAAATAGTPVAPVFTAEKANVNGHVSFDWNKDVTPGYYTLKVKATFTNGYDDKEITRTLIVRDNDYSFNVTGDNAVYNGKVQGLKVAVADMGIENALAQKSVVVYYYTDEARTQQVEPTQAGTYYATVRLQESAYWTEKTFPATFTIKPREVEVVDLVAQAKVYDGTNNANIQEIILNDAEVNSTTGLPTDDKGIIDGDSVYAVGTGYTSQAAAGTADLGVKNVTLMGDDAANYDLTSYSHTEKFNIQRSQVKGAIVSGRTYKYTGKDIKLSASDIYLIDQAGNQLTDYDVTYYYHNGDGVEKVDAMNKMGKYTVIARPEQDNYKGGATETVYVGNTDAPGTLDNNAKSSLITISNTVELYGATNGVTVSATKGTATARYYYNNGTSADWHTDVPANAGRYLVKATVTNDGVTDTAYGIYTIVKARPEFTPTTDKSSMEYTSGRYDGAIGAGFVNGKSNDTAETYITYTGGTIQGVAYEAPTEVGKYIATVHVGETANYTAHEKQVAFEITPKALTITADDISRQQYGAYPDLTASFKGLATGGVAADTSLRDVQIQPELIDKSNYSNDASDQVGNNYKIIAVAALARNYTVSYVDGNMSVTREDPKPYLEIRGMIENGDGATDLAYYGDVIQLYAYGNQIKTTTGDVYNTSSILAWSVDKPALADITQDGLLTVKGVGTVTVTLTRGIGAQQISTTLTFTAKKQEVKVVVPAEDKVYDSTTQDYTSTKTLSAVNAMGIKVFSGNDRFVIANKTRSDVGSQIVTGKVSDSIHSFQSETYGGLFTINVKDVTVTPKVATTTYGTLATGLDYSENTPAGTDKVLTNGMAVSVADAYSNLDVLLDGYEILVAGKENENYNVKYVTDQTAPDVKVTPKALIISTGTLNSDGRTSGYLKDNDQFYMNEGFAITGTTFNLLPNDRMYGEFNPVMDYTFAGFVSGDSEADLVTLLPWLVKYSDGTYHNINGNANVAFDKTHHLNDFRAASFMSGMSAYPIDSMLLANSVKNYTLTSAEATQNIYQRPVTLTVPTGVTLTAYKPTIIDASGSVKTDVLLDLLLNNLVVGKYNDKGGLAELLKHTIKDLKIQIVSASYDDSTKTITATIKLGNTNYWTEDLNFTVKVDPTKIVAKYGPLGWTSASVTMVGVNEHGTETGATYVTGDVWYMIYTKDASAADKYSNYKDKTPVRKVKMTKGSSTGVYIANYDRLPAGEYVMFAIAEGYTIIE